MAEETAQQQGSEGASAEPVAFDPSAHAEAAKKYFETQGFAIKKPADIQAEVDGAVNKTHSYWEAAIAEASGAKKPDDTKGTEWVKSIISSKKDPAPQPDPTPDAKKDALIQALSKEVSEMKTTMAQEKQRAVGIKIRSEVDYELKAIRFNGDDTLDSEIRSDAKDLLGGRYKFDFDEELNRTVAKRKDDDSLIMDTETQEPILLSKLFDKDTSRLRTKDIPKPAGTGIVPPRKKEGVDIYPDKDAILAAAREKGLGSGTVEHHEFYVKACKAAGFDPKE